MFGGVLSFDMYGSAVLKEEVCFGESTVRVVDDGR